MKRIVRYFLIFLILVFKGHVFCGNGISIELPGTHGRLFASLVESRQKQLERVQQERDKLVKLRLESDPELKTLSTDAKNQIDLLSVQLETDTSNEFIKQKLVILNESYQMFNDIIRERDRFIRLLDELVVSLKKFLNDPDFTHFKRERNLSERLFYSLDDVQRIYNMVIDTEKEVTVLYEQERYARAELDSRKRITLSTKELYQEKRERLELGGVLDRRAFDISQRNELIRLEERLYNYKKLFDALRVTYMEYNLEYLAFGISIAKSHMAITKDYLYSIKPSVRVTQADIVRGREDLMKATNSYRNAKEAYRVELDEILAKHEVVERELQRVSQVYGIPLGRDVEEWAREIPQSVQVCLAYCNVALLQTQLMTYQKKQELLEVLIEHEGEKLKDKNLGQAVKESYHKQFMADEEVALEMRQYDSVRTEATNNLLRFKERLDFVADQVGKQKKIIDNIHHIREGIEKLRETLFKAQDAEYEQCIIALQKADTLAKEQIDSLSKLAGAYSSLTFLMTNKIRLIGFITAEMEARTIWYRPEYAISWDGIKNIVPDMINSILYIHSHFVRGAITSTIKNFSEALREPMELFVFALKMLVVLIFFIVCYRFLPYGIRFFEAASGYGFRYSFYMCLAGMGNFLRVYFWWFAVWAMLFMVLIFRDMDTYLYILFYLVSIPYLLYVSYRFVRFMARFNEERGYAFVSAEFQRKLWLVLTVLIYANVSIFFVREAFVLMYYYRSELPTILRAINFIIFQISLILLIDKEQILGIIPTKTDLGLLVYEQVNRLYYPMLVVAIAIIVMSNPYVGFGRLVLYLFFGCLYTAVLFAILYWLHGLFKRMASRIFFVVVDDVARERFSNAKTWFGMIIIISFLVLSFLGLVIGARIWGWSITLARISDFIQHPLIGGDTETAINAVTFFKICAFIMAGLLVAYGLNRFVLGRIFDLLLVDSGVQYTISRITQYLVIIFAVFLGFQSAKLHVLVNYVIGGLIIGLGWVLKEPISDFVSYFIILVQRPVKIGDYIEIDAEIMGVVRNITARAVILRKKNSTTLIVPNSLLINKTIANWNYTHNFVAIDDIVVTVDYRENPEIVREVLYEVVEAFPNVLKNPKPWVRLDGFGECGYEFKVRGFISSVYTLEKWEIASNIRLHIVNAFAKQGIKMAPGRLVLTRSGMRTGSDRDALKG